MNDERSRRSILISNSKTVTEYRAWSNEYTPLSGAVINVSFSPDRGTGLGEMLYDTIAQEVPFADDKHSRLGKTECLVWWSMRPTKTAAEFLNFPSGLPKKSG